MRALFSVQDEMRDEFDEARRIAGFALFGGDNVEPRHCDCDAQCVTALRSKSWRASGASN